MPVKKAQQPLRVGLVSDTHDRCEPKLLELFDGLSLVLHAGDIGETALSWLRERHEVRAVKGNNDVGAWAENLPGARVEEVGGLRVLIIHELGTVERPTSQVQFLLAAERPHLVLSGHSHKPLLAEREGVFYVNPGSAGPKRFSLPRVAGWLDVDDARATVKLFSLEGPKLSPFDEKTFRAPSAPAAYPRRHG